MARSDSCVGVPPTPCGGLAILDHSFYVRILVTLLIIPSNGGVARSAGVGIVSLTTTHPSA